MVAGAATSIIFVAMLSFCYAGEWSSGAVKVNLSSLYGKQMNSM